MDAKPVRALRPPAGLRPAQLGIVLTGRVILGHVSATLVDLAGRGFLGLDEADTDWLLTDRRAEAAAAAGPLLDFEATLLDGLFGTSSLVRLSDLGEGMVPWLNKLRSQVRRDAIRQGWLSRWRRDPRTPRGTDLLSQIRDFRHDVRAAAAAGELPAGLTPYAMIFGLAQVATPSLAVGESTAKRAAADDDEVGWSRGDRFLTSWLAVCSGIPVRQKRPWHGRGTDFAHAWSAPRDHHRGSGHDQGRGGSAGGYGGADADGGSYGGGGLGPGSHIGGGSAGWF